MFLNTLYKERKVKKVRKKRNEKEMNERKKFKLERKKKD